MSKNLAQVAEETVRIAKEGRYQSASGAIVDITKAVSAAVRGTTLVRLEHRIQLKPGIFPKSPRIEITDETTTAAGRRIVQDEEVERVCVLNFASAKNPGGGFLRGTKAQEEDLARASALYECLITQPVYYQENREAGGQIYLDHMIYSPDVPFFRDDRLELLDRPFMLSVITAPAPNAGEVLKRNPSAEPVLRECLYERARRVLKVAAYHRHHTLVLGAWGCGVFRNDPREVADAFAEALDRRRGHFLRVVFAIYEPKGPGNNTRAFRERFGV